MKFYGIDVQGFMKLREYAGTAAPAFDTVGTSDDRKFIYVNNSTTAKDELYVGGVRGNKWVKVVMDDGGTYTSLASQLDGVYHPLTGSTTVAMKAISYAGVSDVTKILDSKLVLDSDSTTADAGIYNNSTTSGQYIMWNDNYYSEYVSTVPGTPSGGAWQINTTTGTLTRGAIATQEWVNEYYNKISSSIGTDVSGLDNYYSKSESEAIFEEINDTHGDFILSSISGRQNLTATGGPAIADQFYASVYYTTEEGTAVTDKSKTIVKRNIDGDIWARVGNLEATSARYADLAEKYTCDVGLPVGTVVGVREHSNYEVEPFAVGYMNGVVGVVSENPAYLMNSGSEGLPIALTGKVPVRVVGPIRKGDFLVPNSYGGTARMGNTNNDVDRYLKFATALETCLHDEERLIECIVK